MTRSGFILSELMILFLHEVKLTIPFGTAMKMAGISGLVWHDLRATFGTRLGEAGFDAFTIAALMGHSQIQTTARYVRATERNKRAAVESVTLDSQMTGHKYDTNEQRPVSLAAVSYDSIGSGGET